MSYNAILHADVKIMSNIVLLLKYENPQRLTDIITDWLYSDTFLRDFLIPAFVECHPGVPHNNDLAILNQLPYRLCMVMIQSPTQTFTDMTYTFVRNSNDREKVPYVNHISHARFASIPDNVKIALILQMIIDNHLTNTQTRLCVCDLYLARPEVATNTFHLDSGKLQDGSQRIGQENLEYLSLLYLSRTPNKLLRGTGIMSSNLMTEFHHSMISLRTQSGTKLMIHDGAFFHCTPSTTLVEVLTIHTVLPELPDITAQELPIRNRFTAQEITEIETAGPREFIRTHYIKTPRYFYTDIEVVHVSASAFMLDCLNAVIAQRAGIPEQIYQVDPNNPLSLDLVIVNLLETNLAVGGVSSNSKSKGKKSKGKKNSRKRGRGTKKDEMLIISCDPSSFYAVSKFNTNLSYIF